MILNAARSQLLVVDVQEKLVPSLSERSLHIGWMIHGSNRFHPLTTRAN